MVGLKHIVKQRLLIVEVEIEVAVVVVVIVRSATKK